jgi:alpha,alpha-trehalose phosphorylase
LRAQAGKLSFAPRLPDGLTRLVFNMSYRGRHLRVTTTSTDAAYELVAGKQLEVSHHGDVLALVQGSTVSRPIPPAAPALPRPTQPPGRAPHPRRAR